MSKLKLAMTLQISQHASIRMQQRGGKPQEAWLLAYFSDQEAICRGRCHSCMVSRECAAELRGEGYSPQIIDRIRRKRLVMDGSTLVTITGRHRKARWN